MIKVRYFAATRDLSGVGSDEFSVEGELLIGDFWAMLVERHSAFAPHRNKIRFAVNDAFVGDDARIKDGDQVDLIPPLAGGESRTFSSIEETPLSIDRVFQFVSQPSAGGVCIFVGLVRNHADGKSVSRLDYEKHPTLAASELDAVVNEVAAADETLRVAAAHRVGKLEVGDLAVVVAASASHRGEAFDACRKAIDTLKDRVPIWKKEWDESAAYEWVNFDA